MYWWLLSRHLAHSPKCCKNHADQMDLHPKVGFDDENDDVTHTPRDCEKVNYSHNEAFQGEQGGVQTGPKII